MESFRIIADHVIKTERQIVVPRVESVVKQKPNPMVNEKKKRIRKRIKKRKQKKEVVQEIPTALTGTMPGRTSQSKKAVPNSNRPKATPRTKKSLVEAKKYRYDWLRLTPCGCSLRVTARKTDGGRLIQSVDLKSVDNHENTLEGLAKILETCEIDTFELSDLGSSLKLLKYWPEIKKCAPFRFKTVKSSESTSINTRNVWENCVGVVQVTSYHADYIYYLTQKWIDIDANVPDRTTGFPSSRLAIPFIASKFGDRVIYEKVNETRIRTDDEAKHILIRRNRDSFGSLFSCTTISSRLLESEYEKSTWFKELTALGSAYEDFTEFE